MSDNEYRHLLGKARDAKRGGRDAWGVMSTGEKVAVALLLNRPIAKVARDLANEDSMAAKR